MSDRSKAMAAAAERYAKAEADAEAAEQPSAPLTKFQVPGAGKYERLGLTSDEKQVKYRFTPDKTGKPVESTMKLADWVRTQQKGQPLTEQPPVAKK
jgi:hypothetical protein